MILNEVRFYEARRTADNNLKLANLERENIEISQKRVTLQTGQQVT